MGYNLTINIEPPNSGTVNVSGITDSEGKYVEGSEVILTATPLGEYQFGGWESSIESFSPDNPLTFTINSDTEIISRFFIPKKTYTLKVKSNQPTFGRVNVIGAAFQNEDGGYSVYSIEDGNQIQLQGIANTGYEFTSWSNGVTDSVYVFIASQDLTISASFDVQPVVPQEANIISLDSSEVLLNNNLTGQILLNDDHTYNFYWGNQLEQKTVWEGATVSNSEVILPVGDVFENLMANSQSDTFYLRVTADNTTESLFQQEIPFKVNIPDDYKPFISFKEIVLHKTFNNINVAGYSGYTTSYEVGELPTENSSTITTTNISPNFGNCTINYPNLIFGTFATNSNNYTFNLHGRVTDSRGRVGEITSNNIEVRSYELPKFTLISSSMCDKDGNIDEDPLKNTYCKIEFNVVHSENITGNNLPLENIYFIINEVEYRNKVRFEDSRYVAIIGGDLVPSSNYVIYEMMTDLVMDELEISPVIYTVQLSGKMPLSLYDDKSGAIGMATGVVASLPNKVDLALDTYFRDNVNLESNAYFDGENREARISSYDLVHNSVRVYEEDHNDYGTYGNILRTMTGYTYQQLRNDGQTDSHTLYFLNSVPEGSDDDP